jgi:hypothetical protein
VADTPPHRCSSGFAARLGKTLLEKLLNRSSQDYVSRLTGGDSYWDEAIQFQNSLQAGSTDVSHDYYTPAQPPPSSPAGRNGEDH